MGRKNNISYITPQQNPQPIYIIPGKFNGMISQGNIDLASRPQVKLPDGRIATVRSASYNIGGKEVLLPTISKDGQQWTDQQAIDNYLKTGENLGVFDNPDNATNYAIALHNQQAQYYNVK